MKIFSEPSRNASTERFIGALTMALGIGALIPRTGFGLYSILEQSGNRGLWAMVMLAIGCWTIAGSYLTKMLLIRITILSLSTLLWFAIIYKFLDSALWGAALQGFVIVIFAIDTIFRLFYNYLRFK